MTASDGEQLFFIDPVCSQSPNTNCAVRALPIAGGPPRTLCSSLQTALYVVATSTALYVLDGDTLIKLAKN
jgi:hypothetical protein